MDSICPDKTKRNKPPTKIKPTHSMMTRALLFFFFGFSPSPGLEEAILGFFLGFGSLGEDGFLFISKSISALSLARSSSEMPLRAPLFSGSLIA